MQYPEVFSKIAKGATPLYNLQERVKTFDISRDPELENILLDSVKLGVEYYKSITLNMIE